MRRWFGFAGNKSEQRYPSRSRIGLSVPLIPLRSPPDQRWLDGSIAVLVHGEEMKYDLLYLFLEWGLAVNLEISSHGVHPPTTIDIGYWYCPGAMYT